MNCRVCGAKLVEILTYDNQPNGAQTFVTKEMLGSDKGITLYICHCTGCGLVQLANTPVPYYNKAVRTSAWMKQPWRKEQLTGFISRYGLKGKKIKTINSFPVIGKYNAFLMFNYLEHLPDPKVALRQIMENLEYPYRGIIEVPNFEMVVEDGVYSEFIIDHLLYFTPETLEYLLKACGFRINSWQYYSHGYILSAEVYKPRPISIDRLKIQEQKVQDSIEEYMNRFDKVAMWGAGHQALMILTGIRSRDKIIYIVDSSPIKQGKYTQITHLPIKAPTTLQDEPVEALIICVGGFWDSVLQQLNNMELNYKLSVAVIKETQLEEIV